MTPTTPLGMVKQTWIPTIDGSIDATAATYAWVITEDRIEDGRSKGRLGPSNADDHLLEIVQKSGSHRVRFRMYDDDGNYYYGGYVTYIAGSDDEDAAFGALADFGIPFAGAVQILYKDRPELDCS